MKWQPSKAIYQGTLNLQEHPQEIPLVIETWISCQQDSVWSHDKRFQGNWVGERAGKVAHLP